MQVGISPDLIGTGVPLCRIGVEDADTSVGGLYFQMDLLAGGGKIRQKLQQSSASYDKIRVVGKGAFGSAVLYRRRDDDSLVILKEINMHDLSAQERVLALNEVAVLSKLEHPNIISYFDSFEEDGILMIEMEYADGGTLSQYLAKRDRPLEEKEVLQLFQQMVSAVRYLHENNVLHRDLKTANIFLTKENSVKVGDFGISKVMGTQTKYKGATTVLGTPYYISPEMCEGKPYDEKSDVWALGCILYETACLQKTFEGSNLPALVKKIMAGQYDQVRGNYSTEFKALIGEMLNKDADMRPTAHELLYHRLPDLLCRYEGTASDYVDDDVWSSSDSGAQQYGKRRRLRSVLYVFNRANYRLTPVDGLHTRIRIRQVAISDVHVLLVTAEKLVFGWGDNTSGQLGTGDRLSKSQACLVESLTGKSIVNIGAGNGFSLFCSDNGIVMTCGKALFLGQGRLEDDLLRPRLVDSLLSLDIYSVACGPSHTVVVGEGGKTFSWGCGKDGRLGTGKEQDEYVPVEIAIPSSVVPRSVRCGIDGTMLITDCGSLLAMGSNQLNKLNLNRRQGFIAQMKLTKVEVDKVSTPTLLRGFGCRVVDVSLGASHGGVLLESGHIHMFGCNSQGQLGRGNTVPAASSGPVKHLGDKACVMIQCGEDFTLAATAEHSLYFWGNRQFRSTSSNSTRTSETIVESASLRGKTVAVVRPFSVENSDVIKDGEDYFDSSLNTTMSWQRGLTANSATTKAFSHTPVHVLRLDSSGSASVRQQINLGSVVCNGMVVYVVVETSAPLPKRHQKRHEKTKGTLFQKINSATNTTLNGTHVKTKHSREEITSAKTETKMPTWIRRELDQGEILQMPITADVPPKSDYRRKPSTSSDSSVSEKQAAAKRRTEKKARKKRAASNNDEVTRLLKEKAEAESRLRALQTQYSRQAQVEEIAKGREQGLLDEISALREQLLQQKHVDRAQTSSAQNEQQDINQTAEAWSDNKTESPASRLNKSKACLIQ